MKTFKAFIANHNVRHILKSTTGSKDRPHHPDKEKEADHLAKAVHHSERAMEFHKKFHQALKDNDTIGMDFHDAARKDHMKAADLHWNASSSWSAGHKSVVRDTKKANDHSERIKSWDE